MHFQEEYTSQTLYINENLVKIRNIVVYVMLRPAWKWTFEYVMWQDRSVSSTRSVSSHNLRKGSCHSCDKVQGVLDIM